MLCDENITWGAGIPCEWVGLLLPLCIVIAILFGAAIPYVVWSITLNVHGFFNRKIEARRRRRRRAEQYSGMSKVFGADVEWSKDGDTARIVTELNARKRCHKHKYVIRESQMWFIEFRCSICGRSELVRREHLWPFCDYKP